MGWTFADAKPQVDKEKQSIDLYHKLECKACPLNKIKDNANPHMPASGSAKPLVYILGEAPGADEDYEGRQFVGRSGMLLRHYIPDHMEKRIRWNNVVRTRPVDNVAPDQIAVECCRPSIERDIEQTKPRAIFGMGNVPLSWAIGHAWAQGQAGIVKWRGRRLPIRIGKHTCWYYPMLHPSGVLRVGGGESPQGFVFGLDLQRAFAEVDSLTAIPRVHSRQQVFEGVEIVTTDMPRAAERIVKFLRQAAKADQAGLDFETKHLRPYRPGAAICTMAVSLPERTLAFPYMHPKHPWSKEAMGMIRDAVHDFFTSACRKIVHNLPFEMEWIATDFGRYMLREGKWDCSMSQAAILDERVGAKIDEKDKQKDRSCLGLGFLTLQYFGINIKTLSDIDTTRIADEPLEATLLYNGGDAKYHRLLFDQQTERLKAEGLFKFYRWHIRRAPTVVLTQIKGIPLDDAEARKQEAKLKSQLFGAAAAIAGDPDARLFKKECGTEFNPLSNDDTVKLFRDVLQLPNGRQRNGKYKVNEATLLTIKRPIAKRILEYKKPNKLLSTYIWTKDSPIVYPDGRLHPILNINYAESGRLSSEDPNQQNIPIRDNEGKMVRKQIIAPPGYIGFSVDYGQIEARCIAMESQDKAFVKALWTGYDVHGEWATKLANVYPRAIGGEKFLDDKAALKKYRNAKVKGGWVFALFFGAQLETAARQVGVPAELCGDLYDEFWDTFKGVKEWQERIKRSFQKKGYIENLMGRRRRAPLTPNQIFNTGAQGLAADIVLDGMNKLSEQEDWDLQPIMQIHDDFGMLFPEKRFDELAYTTVDTLMSVDYEFLNVPLLVECSVWSNLYEKQEAAIYRTDTWKIAK